MASISRSYQSLIVCVVCVCDTVGFALISRPFPILLMQTKIAQAQTHEPTHLREAGEEGPGEEHAGEGLGEVLKAQGEGHGVGGVQLRCMVVVWRGSCGGVW